MQHSNQSMQKRSFEIDVFRGLALVFIVVNHTAGSVFSWGTSRNFGISEATEQFVFLAGVVTAFAYMSKARRLGTQVANARMFRRTWEIYWAFLLTAALMVTAGGILLFLELETPAFHQSEVMAFLTAPWRTVFQVFTLQRQPFLSDILPMYAFFAILTPVAIRLARMSWTYLLLASFVMWTLAPWLASLLHSAGPSWTFNPFAWQLVFSLGLIVGMYPGLPNAPSGMMRSLLIVAAVMVTIAGAIFSLFSYHESLRNLFVSGWPEQGLGIFSKTNASLARVLNFVAMAWLVYLALQRGWLDRVIERLSWMAIVGRNGLACFVGGAVISIFAEALSFYLGGGDYEWQSAVLADLIAVVTLIAFAMACDAYHAKNRGIASQYGKLPQPARETNRR